MAKKARLRKSAVVKYASTEPFMTVSDIASSMLRMESSREYPDKPEGAELPVSASEPGAASASRFFSNLLQPCSFKSVLPTAYCNHVGVVPQSCSLCSANSSHSSCPTHEMHNITLKTTTNQSVSWVNQTLLSFYPCTIIIRAVQ
jgi:hypothetical protein